jgi:GT2 family glycosyltransferase
VEGADLVVTTAERLRQKWAPHNANTLLVRNGVDADFFAENCVPSGLLIDVAHPIIGFTGAIAPWVDLALVAAVARARPDWTFVLVGDVVIDIDLFGLDHMSNVIMTGLQPYPSMPRFLFWFDVAMIPFVVDQISAAVDPVKFYEYAASGAPIVTSPLPEIDEHRHLMYQGDDPVSFELAIEAALVEDPALRRERIALARSNTWIDRYAEFDRATRKLWPQLSVVIVTYGQLAFTRRCLETLLGNTSYPRLEVIVVDNGSTDGTPMFLRGIADQDQRITAILNPDNRGFAAANNQGLAAATGEVLVLLNNDTEVSPGWHVPLLRHLDDPTIGLIGPRSDHVGNAAQIDVDIRYVNDFDGFTRLLQRDHDGELFEMTMLGMFCVAMRREVYATVGALDEAYGIGLFEDDDYAERVRAAGWRVVCARDAFVHHVGQATFRSLIESGEYHEIWSRNRARFESRWGPWRAQQDGVQPRTVG